MSSSSSTRAYRKISLRHSSQLLHFTLSAILYSTGFAPIMSAPSLCEICFACFYNRRQPIGPEDSNVTPIWPEDSDRTGSRKYPHHPSNASLRDSARARCPLCYSAHRRWEQAVLDILRSRDVEDPRLYTRFFVDRHPLKEKICISLLDGNDPDFTTVEESAGFNVKAKEGQCL